MRSIHAMDNKYTKSSTKNELDCFTKTVITKTRGYPYGFALQTCATISLWNKYHKNSLQFLFITLCEAPCSIFSETSCIGPVCYQLAPFLNFVLETLSVYVKAEGQLASRRLGASGEGKLVVCWLLAEKRGKGAIPFALWFGSLQKMNTQKVCERSQLPEFQLLGSPTQFLWIVWTHHWQAFSAITVMSTWYLWCKGTLALISQGLWEMPEV